MFVTLRKGALNIISQKRTTVFLPPTKDQMTEHYAQLKAKDKNSDNAKKENKDESKKENKNN
ncbi:hypothetical protein A3Q56_03749 [Intoshia linei]|uniref:Uncharacterized protein n=1 Tax=Intoshia linei TaxID=1819745 RepID=A0A177B205_9BILA|nr:hypothetical protein A3Q56_03749 [Intoshia linei]